MLHHSHPRCQCYKDRIQSSKYDCMPLWMPSWLWHWPIWLQECDSWAVRTGKALAAPQDSSSRTMDSPGESRASFFCFLHQINWRVSCKTRTSTRTFWTFCHFYKSSKSHQVAHPWFQKSASTEVFLPWPKVESIWINWIQSLPHPLKHLTVS